MPGFFISLTQFCHLSSPSFLFTDRTLSVRRKQTEFESSTSLASWPTPGISPLLSSKAACRLTLNQVAQLGETETETSKTTGLSFKLLLFSLSILYFDFMNFDSFGGNAGDSSLFWFISMKNIRFFELIFLVTYKLTEIHESFVGFDFWLFFLELNKTAQT